MSFIVALTGFSGVGKTTAIEYLVRQGHGERIYLGKIILDEVSARKLPAGPINEKLVRLELRGKEGPEVLLVRSLPAIEECLRRGTNAFIDAIFDIGEWKYLRDFFKSTKMTLLGISASFETRATRLAARNERPITPTDLRVRDETELALLKTGEVLDQATQIIENNNALAKFYEELEQFWIRTISSQRS